MIQQMKVQYIKRQKIHAACTYTMKHTGIIKNYLTRPQLTKQLIKKYSLSRLGKL